MCDLKPIQWEFAGENWLHAGAVQNPAFHPCVSTGMYGKVNVEHKRFKSLKFLLFSHKDCTNNTSGKNNIVDFLDLDLIEIT